MPLEEEKRRDAEKCVKIAEIALNKHNFDKAERFLHKAERLYPMALTKQLLKDVQNDRERILLNNNDTHTEKDAIGAECTKIAQKAIADGDFSKAKRFLERAIRICSSAEATKILNELDDLENSYSPTSYTSNGTDKEGCRDDAETCIENAEKAFAKLQLGKAERFIAKAERFYPTLRAIDLLRQIKDARQRGVEDVDKRKPQKSGHVPPRKKNDDARKQEEKRQMEEMKKLEDVAAEQVETIRRVRSAKDDYVILGLPPNSGPKEVKKAHRRLYKLLHPDKNKAPEAKEAFMIVNEVVERLTSLKRAPR